LRSHQEDADARDRAFEEEDRALGTVATVSAPSVQGNVDSDVTDTNESTDSDSSDSTDLTDYESDSSKGKLPNVAPLRFSSRNEGNQNTRTKRIPKTTHATNVRDSLRKMNDNLRGVQKPIELPYKKKPFQPKLRLYLIDICGISAAGFHLSLYNPKSEVFTTSLYEIDRILDARQETKYDTQEEAQIPDAYSDLVDVSSKEASDILAPHRPYDHKIELTGPNTLGFSPLYKMTTQELEETKRYLLDNLAKGFIEPS
jgi:hypothetical protein